MRLIVLGTSAGGGCPQWNCSCGLCRTQRNGTGSLSPRSEDSIAISGDGKTWHLINAAPDVRGQLARHPCLHPDQYPRGSPVASILLTDADLDHTLGLLTLRESASFAVRAPAPVIKALTNDFPVRKTLEPYAHVSWEDIPIERPFALDASKLEIKAFALGSKPPRYAKNGSSDGSCFVCGYRIHDGRSGGTVAYAPSIAAWTDEVERLFDGADLILSDGTFSSERELADLGTSSIIAAEMGHLPLFGENALAFKLSGCKTKRRFLTHINNTNPVLHPDSKERSLLNDLDIELAFDGMEIEI